MSVRLDKALIEVLAKYGITGEVVGMHADTCSITIERFAFDMSGSVLTDAKGNPVIVETTYPMSYKKI